MKCRIEYHFIWILTVYKSTHLGVTLIQFLKVKESLDLLVSRSTGIKLMKIEQVHEISNYVILRPAKPQISLHIRAV